MALPGISAATFGRNVNLQKPKSPYLGFRSQNNNLQTTFANQTQGLYDKALANPLLGGVGFGRGGAGGFGSFTPSATSPLLLGHKQAMMGDARSAVDQTIAGMAPQLRASRGFAARGGDPLGGALRSGLESVAGMAGGVHERAANLAHRDWADWAGVNEAALNALASMFGTSQSNQLGAAGLGLQGRTAEGQYGLGLMDRELAAQQANLQEHHYQDQNARTQAQFDFGMEQAEQQAMDQARQKAIQSLAARRAQQAATDQALRNQTLAAQEPAMTRLDWGVGLAPGAENKLQFASRLWNRRANPNLFG